MDALRIRSCCCVSLFTAGLILGSVELILAVVSIILIPVLMVSVFQLIVNILWLYGIYVKNHKLLLPSMILTTVLCLWSLVIPVICIYEEFYSHQWGYDYRVSVRSIGGWSVAALCAFIWNLKYSIYKHMVESTHGSHVDCSNI